VLRGILLPGLIYAIHLRGIGSADEGWQRKNPLCEALSSKKGFKPIAIHINTRAEEKVP
jgi:hypothetical protein